MPYTLAFDPTGSAPENLIIDEPHSISSTLRFIAFDKGLIYTPSLVVKRASDDVVLTVNTDYRFFGISDTITAYTGIETAGALYIVDDNFTGNLKLTYQAVGGPEGNNCDTLRNMMDRIAELQANGIPWDKILDKPVQYPPEPHEHSLETDIYDWEVLVKKLDEMVRAIRDSRSLMHSASQLDDEIHRMYAVFTENQRDLQNQALTMHQDIESTVDAMVQQRINELLPNN